MHSRFFLFVSLAALFLGATSCKKEKQGVTNEPPAAHGRRLYLQYCIACHNGEPKQDGMVGPANAGASLELLRSKILKGEYPLGYTPKRSTRAMPPIPTLKDAEIEAIHAYLNQ